MDPIKTIGTKLTGNEERDCVHIAIFPAIIGEEGLRIGDDVAIIYGTENHIRSAERYYEKPIGIIDPFLDPLDGRLKKGDRVWVFLFPGSITGMRHVWNCPAIDGLKPPINESEKWLREFAEKWRFDYDVMIKEACENGGCIVARGKDLHGPNELDFGEENDFWYHIQKLTGKTFEENHKDNFIWSCSC